MDYLLAFIPFLLGWLLSGIVGPLLARRKHPVAQRIGSLLAGLLPLSYEKKWKADVQFELIDPARIGSMARDELYPIFKDYVRRSNALARCIGPARARLAELDTEYRKQIERVGRMKLDREAKALRVVRINAAMKPENENGTTV